MDPSVSHDHQDLTVFNLGRIGGDAHVLWVVQAAAAGGIKLLVVPRTPHDLVGFLDAVIADASRHPGGREHAAGKLSALVWANVPLGEYLTRLTDKN